MRKSDCEARGSYRVQHEHTGFCNNAGLESTISVLLTKVMDCMWPERNLIHPLRGFQWNALTFCNANWQKHENPIQAGIFPERNAKRPFSGTYTFRLWTPSAHREGGNVPRPRMLAVDITHSTDTQYVWLVFLTQSQHIHPQSCEDLLFCAFYVTMFADTQNRKCSSFDTCVQGAGEEGKVLNWFQCEFSCL